MPATIVGPISVAPGLAGGVSSALNITAPTVIKTAPGIAASLTCIAAGSSGSLTLNDCTTTGAAAATNEFYAALFSALSAGKTVKINWPCASGIVISSVPTGSQFSLAFS